VTPHLASRREFLAACSAGVALALHPAAATEPAGPQQAVPDKTGRKAQIAITLDLEMSREYPRRGMLEWDFEKGNLDQATKQYAVDAARTAAELGGVIHFFCVGRVLEQPDADWLKGIAASGHPIGNHTYDHVYLLAKTADEVQFRFRRAPWLIADKTVDQILRENIQLTTAALRQRCGISANGFRTPGGFAAGLKGREDVQRMLLDLGFRWCSSLYPPHPTGPPKQQPTDEVYAGIVAAQEAAQPFIYPSGLIEVPMSPISDVNAFRTNYWKLDWFLKAIRMSLEWAIERGAVFDFLAHPSCLVVEDPEFQTIRLICDLVKKAGDRAEIVGLDKIAASVRGA
jgi:peptidoglycan/xylan/chitin deacetylase (PgdA/CDA1 family)